MVADVEVINYPTSGVTLVLGRNGSGKSRLLDGILRLAYGRYDQITNDYLDVSLICSVQTSDQFKHWKEFRESLYEPFLEDGVNETDFNNLIKESFLRYYSYLCQTLCGDVITFPFPFVSRSPIEVLKMLQFSSDVIQGWEEREQIRSEIQRPRQHNIFSTDFSIEQLMPELLLRLLSNSLSSEKNSWQDPEFVIEASNRWLSDPKLCLLFSEAFGQFYSLAQKIQISVGKSGHQIRFLVETPVSGPLQTFIDEVKFQIEHQQNPPTSDELTHGVLSEFPLSFYRTVDLGALGSFITTDWLPYGEKSLSEATTAIIFDIHRIDQFLSNDSRIQEIENRLRGRFLRTGNSVIVDDKWVVEIGNLAQYKEFVEQIGTQLLDLDIGIDGLRFDKSVRTRLYSFLQYMGTDNIREFLPQLTPFETITPVAKFTIDVDLDLQFRDSLTQEWLPLIAASQGQIDVILILLNIGLLKGDSMLLLVDEFDQHLHPSSARLVLKRIQEVIHGNGGVALFTTHSSATISTGFVKRLFTRKNMDGTFDITTDHSHDNLGVQYQLGLNELEVSLLKKLVIIVEGTHDELIIRNLFYKDNAEMDDLWFVPARGASGFSQVWGAGLGLFSQPVLLVYDKKNLELEFSWDKAKLLAQNNSATEVWKESGLKAMMSSIADRRKRRQSRSGDIETESVLHTMKKALDDNQSQRLSLHGLDADDIVMLIPPKYFPKVSDWEEVKRIAKINHWTGTEWKAEFGVTARTIAEALKMNQDEISPEFQQLFSHIKDLIGRI